AEWRDEHRRRTPGAVKMRLERVARHRGVDNQRVGTAASGLDPAQMILRLAGLGVFRKLDRDQVVHQADKASATTFLQPDDGGGFFEMMGRYQKIDRRFGAVSQLDRQRTLGAGQQRYPGLPCDPEGLPIMPCRITLAAPGGVDRGDKSLRSRLRDETQPAP